MDRLNFVNFSHNQNGGECGIRTHGTLRPNGFQDRRIRPLCQLSEAELRERGHKNQVVLANHIKYKANYHYANSYQSEKGGEEF